MKVVGVVSGVFLLMLHVSSGVAQSVITLEDFDLSSDVGVAAEESKSDLENCLLKIGNCASDELKSGASFSLDDVLNLGVIDHEKVAPAPVSAVSGDASQPASPSTYADPLPSVDMEILFDYDSADIRWDQKNRLIDLAKTLSTDGFRSYSLLFVGHTDAKGSAQYNRHLSGQRAGAVADFIRVNTAIPSHQIISSGIGFDKLKDWNDPLSPRNRRVQLVLVPLRK
tara:strand:+ start:83 stop:760 length:678 start_codon:yes stop_codon:yes gene_type:complete